MKLALVVAASLLTLGAGRASAASFDCGKARTPDEKTICADRALNDQDVRMAQLYQITQRLVPMGSRDAIKDRQTVWLRERNRCRGERRCLSRAYDQRIGELDQVMQRVYRQGPF